MQEKLVLLLLYELCGAEVYALKKLLEAPEKLFCFRGGEYFKAVLSIFSIGQLPK